MTARIIRFFEVGDQVVQRQKLNLDVGDDNDYDRDETARKRFKSLFRQNHRLIHQAASATETNGSKFS